MRLSAQSRDRQWRSTADLRARRKQRGLSHIMNTMSMDELSSNSSSSAGNHRRGNRRKSRPNSPLLPSSSPRGVASEIEEDQDLYNSDPMFQVGETVSLNRQRLRVAELLKLCRNQDVLAPSFEPIKGLHQKTFRSQKSRLQAINKLRSGGHADDVKANALPPRYQPTRSVTLELERMSDELPKTVSAALVSADETVRHLNELLGETTGSSKSSVDGGSRFLTPYPGNPLNESARGRNETKQREGVEHMTNGILQNSYLIERFLQELELVGQFGGGNSNESSGKASASVGFETDDPTVVKILRNEISLLVKDLADSQRAHSLAQMEVLRMKREVDIVDNRIKRIQKNFSAKSGGNSSGGGGGGSGGGSGGGKSSGARNRTVDNIIVVIGNSSNGNNGNGNNGNGNNRSNGNNSSKGNNSSNGNNRSGNGSGSTSNRGNGGEKGSGNSGGNSGTRSSSGTSGTSGTRSSDNGNGNGNGNGSNISNGNNNQNRNHNRNYNRSNGDRKEDDDTSEEDDTSDEDDTSEEDDSPREENVSKKKGAAGRLRKQNRRSNVANKKVDELQKNKTKTLRNSASTGQIVKATKNKAAAIRRQKVHDSNSQSTSRPLSEKEGELIFQLEETKREWDRRLAKQNAEIQRANALVLAADLERNHAEEQMIVARNRLGHAKEDDLHTLLRSLQDELEQAQQQTKETKVTLERERTNRSVGSVRFKQTQTEVQANIVHTSTQTTSSGPIQKGKADGSKNGDDDDEDDGKKSTKKKRKKPKMKGKNQWVKAAQYWQEQLPNNGEGLLHFAKNYNLKDVSAHSTSRTMLLLRAIMEDKIGGDEHEREESLGDYLSEWCLNKYGLQSIAVKEHAKLLISVRAHANEHERIALFARMIGIQRNLPAVVTQFVLYIWGILRKNFDATNKNLDKGDQSAYIATSYCVEAVPLVFGERRPFCSYELNEKQKSRLIKRIWELDKSAKHKSHGRHQICVSEILDIFVSEWESESFRLDQQYRALFEASDVNGDQELTLDEFRAMIKFVEMSAKVASSGFSGSGSVSGSPLNSRPTSAKTNVSDDSTGSFVSRPTSSSRDRPTSPKRRDSSGKLLPPLTTTTYPPVNVVQLYQKACQKSHQLSDAQLPPDQITPQGFAVTMQTAYRGRPIPPALLSIPLIAEDKLRKAVKSRWEVAKPGALDRATNLVKGDEDEEKEFIIMLIHRISELSEYPNEEHLMAAWIAMDMLQNMKWILFDRTDSVVVRR
tara:strand:+ start:1806 stop:5528 length:3723 start_codon:yes stop_codon:yes gene_type:complete